MLQSFANMFTLGNEEKPGHWKCPIKTGDEVGDCTFIDVQSKTIEE
jgi:hypothetical protein